MIATDLDLVDSIQPGLTVPYETALKFANAIPDYSLLQYRDLAFLVCQFLAQKFELTFEATALHARINELHEAQLINAAQKDLLHRLRKLGNHGAHKAENSRAVQHQTEGPSAHLVDQRLGRLREEVEQAREIFLELVCDLYKLANPNKNIAPFERAPIGEQDHKEVLYAAIKESLNWRAQYEAGITYEQLADEYSNKTGIVKSVPAWVHWISLLNKALASYEAAWKQSAIDTQREPELAFVEYRNPDNRMAQLCDLEPLYHYCRLSFLLFELNNDPDAEWSALAKSGWKLLLKAADRDHPGANTLAGRIYLNGLPGKGPEWTLAARYLNNALKLGAEDVHLQLYQYYLDADCVDFDIDAAFEYLQEGEANGCVECLFELGLQHYHGEFIGKDEVVARAKLEQAAAKGHQRASFSLDLYFGGLVEKMQQGFAEEFGHYDLTNDPIVKPPKIGRNEPCPCGSGAKFKKCCGGGSFSPDRDFPFLQGRLR